MVAASLNVGYRLHTDLFVGIFIAINLNANTCNICVTIFSIEVSKQMLCSTSWHVNNKTYKRKSIMDQLHSSKRTESEYFPISIDVCSVFPSIRASRNCFIMDLRTSQPQLIFHFSMCALLLGSKFILMIEHYPEGHFLMGEH